MINLRPYQLQALEAEARHRAEHPDETRLAVVMATGLGKGHPLDTEVPTPDGLRRWGDLVVGDRVIGSDGLPVTVTAVFDRGTLPAYRVTFTDGASVEVDADHLWNVRSKRSYPFKTMSTAEIAAGPLRAARGYSWQIPMVPRVHRGRIELPLDPYVVGALIANGGMTSTGTVLTTPDPEVPALISTATECRKMSRPEGTCEAYSLPGLVSVTRALGMRVRSGEKRIPRAYLGAAVDQRIGLLHGLMDGDGSTRHERRSVIYHTTSPGLAEDVCELVTSLGGTASISRYDRDEKGVVYGVYILLPTGVSAFRSSRKTHGVPRVREFQPRRSIVSIEYVGDKPIRCIAVDAEDQLYLITRRHIVTHNTIIMAERARRYIDSFEGAGNRVLLLVHTDELAQQAEAKVRLIAEAPITVGVVKADRDECTADIVIASVQTLLQPGRRERITDVGLVLVDECELYAAPRWKAILRYYGCFDECICVPVPDPVTGIPLHAYECFCPATPALGFTATLERGDGQGLGGIWQNVCFSRDISWGVRKGYLVQPIGHRLEIDPSPSYPLMAFAPDASALDDQLIEAMAPEKIVEKWLELAKGRPTIAFMPLVRSAKELRLAFIDAGIDRVACVWGEMPDALRQHTIQAYRDGHLDVLVNAMVLTRGFDAPKTSCVIIGRPTKSRNLGIQMAGRGLRPAPGIPVEDQDCILIYVQDATTDLFTHADLSDKPMDRKAQGALTALEDAWDLGKELDEANRQALWTGQVDAKEFDPLVARSSKVWRHTKHGTPFLPISKDGEYVFVVGTSVWAYAFTENGFGAMSAKRLHKDLPDLELALSVAEDEAQERGGDLGRLLADKDRAWRKAVPSTDMKEFAARLGLFDEMGQILTDRRSGKAGRLSDLISQVQATRALEPMVKRIKEAMA